MLVKGVGKPRAAQEQQQCSGTTTTAERETPGESLSNSNDRFSKISGTGRSRNFAATLRISHKMPPLPPAAAKKVVMHVGPKANAGLVTAGHRRNGGAIGARLPRMNPRDAAEPRVSFTKRNTTSATGDPREGMKCIPEVELGAKVSAAIGREAEEKRAAPKGQTPKLDCLECGGNRYFITNSQKRSLLGPTKVAFLSCCCILAGWQLLCTAPVDRVPVQDAKLSFTKNVKVASINNSINSRWKERYDECCYYSNTPTTPHRSSRTGTTSRSKVCGEHGGDYDPCGGYARKKVLAAAAGVSVQQLLKQKDSLLSFPSALMAEAKSTVASGLVQRRLEKFIEQQPEEETEKDDSQDEEEGQLEQQQQQQQSPWEASMEESREQQAERETQTDDSQDEEEAQIQQQQQQSPWKALKEESREQQGREESDSHYQSEEEQRTQHSCYRVDPSSIIPFYIDFRAFARSRCRQGEQVSTFAGGFDLHSPVAAGSASPTAALASRDPLDEVQDAEKEDYFEEENVLNSRESIRRASKNFEGESPVRLPDTGKPLDMAASSAAPPCLDESGKGIAFAGKWKTAVRLGLRSASSAAATAASFLQSAADAVKTAFASRSVADTIPPTEPSRDSTKAASASAAAPETATLAYAGEDVVLQFLSVDWAALSELYRGPAFHASHTMPSAAAAEDATKNRYALTDGLSSSSRTGSHDDPAAPVGTSRVASATDQPAQRTGEKCSSNSSSSFTAADGETAHLLHHQSTAQRLLHNAKDKSISTDPLEERRTIVLPPGNSAATASDSSITGTLTGISVHTAATLEEVPRSRPFSSAAGAFAAAARAAEALIGAEAVTTHQSHTPVRDRSSTRQLHRGIEDKENHDLLLVEEQSAKRGAVALLRCVVKQQKTHKQQHTSTQSPHVPTHSGVHTESSANLQLPGEEVASHNQQQKQQQRDDMQQRLVLRSHGIGDLEPVVLMPAPAQLQRQLAFKLQLHRQQRDADQKTQKEEEQHSKQETKIPHIQQHPTANSSTSTEGPSHDPLPALLQVVVPVEQSRIAAAWLRRVLLGPGIVATRWEAAALSAATASNGAHSRDSDAASAGGVFTDASALSAAAAAGADQRASGKSAGGERQQQGMKRRPGAGQRQARRFLLKERDQQQQQEEEDASSAHQRFSPHRRTPLPTRDKQQHARDREEAAKEREERRQTVLQLPVWLIEIPLRDVVEAWLPQPGYRQNLERYPVNSSLQSARAAAANGSAEEQEDEPKPDLAAKINQVIETFALRSAGDVMEDDVAAPTRELEAAASEASTEEEIIPLETAATLHGRGGESAWTSLRPGAGERRGGEQMLEGQSLLRRRELLYAEVDRTLPFVLQQLQHYILFRNTEGTAAAVRASTKSEVERDEEGQQPLREDAEYSAQHEDLSASPSPRDYQQHRQYRNEQQQARRAENYSYTKISAFSHPTWAPHRNSHTQSNMQNSQRSGSSIGERANRGFMMAQVYVAGIQLRCAFLHSIGEVCANSYKSSVPEAIAEAVRRSLVKDDAHLGVSIFSALATPPPVKSDNMIRPGAAVQRYAGGSEVGRNNEQAAWAAAEAPTHNKSEWPATAAGEYHTGNDMPQSSARNVWLPPPHELVLVQHKHANENSDTIFYSLTCRCVFTPALETKAPTAGAVEKEVENHQLNTIPGELDATEEICRTSSYHVPLMPISEDLLTLLPRTHYC